MKKNGFYTSCSICNKQIYRRPYQTKTKNPFCSFKCYGEWQKINRKGQNKKEAVFVKCSTCGKTKQIVPCEIKQSHHFCNHGCMGKWKSIYQSGDKNAAWLGGHKHYRGNNWKQQSQLARNRDDSKCQKCGEIENLVVHHIKPYHCFSTHIEANKLDNLTTLCTKCHGLEEFELIKNGKHKNRQFPNTVLPKTCIKCNKLFYGSPRSLKCIKCCTFKCKECGKEFISRKRGNISFCSFQCFQVSHIKNSKYKRQCVLCGKKIKWGSKWCWSCFSKNMKTLVKSGRKKKH